MRLDEPRYLEGTNRWSHERMVAFRVRGVPPETVSPAARAALSGAFATLRLPPSLADAGARLDHALAGARGWGEGLAALAGFLQLLSGDFDGPRFAATAEDERAWDLALVCEEFPHGDACVRAAVELADRLIAGDPFDLDAIVRGLVHVADETCLGGTIYPMLLAAKARGIPIARIDDYALVQLGEGLHQRRIKPATTELTGWIAEQVSCDKAYVKSLWARAGVPVAAGRVVRDEDEAVATALEVGWPIAVKPTDADYGIGVTLQVRSMADLRAAYRKARDRSEGGLVLVERNLVGLWHRLLVVNDELVAAARREPPAVIGDGRQSIAELVDTANRDPRRGPNHRWPLHELVLDHAASDFLAEHGLSTASVPAAGQCVVIRKFAYTEYGSGTVDVLETVHPRNRDDARDAVRLVGLDMAGLDVIASDLSVPLAEQEGGFLEINASPMITIHTAPICPTPRPVGERIVAALFPGAHDGRVTLVVVIDSDEVGGKVAALLRDQGRATALSTRSRTSWGDRELFPQGPTPADRLRAMTFYPRTEAAVLVVALEEVVAHGLGTDRMDVLVLTEKVEDETLARQLEGAARQVVKGTGANLDELARAAIEGLGYR